MLGCTFEAHAHIRGPVLALLAQSGSVHCGTFFGERSDPTKATARPSALEVMLHDDAAIPSMLPKRVAVVEIPPVESEFVMGQVPSVSSGVPSASPSLSTH